MISQSWHNCFEAKWGEHLVLHFVVCIVEAQISPFACQTGLVFRPSEGRGGSRARLLSNFAASIQAVKTNNQQIMRPWFVNYERVKRCTKGSDRRHLSPAASAVWLYHRKGNITCWCLHKRSISISQKCNSFHPSLSQGIDSPKNIQWFFFKANKTKKRSRKASSLIFCPFPTSLLVYFLVEILLECKVNRLRYSEGLGLARRCQISRWAPRVDSSDTAMAAVQERGSARRFKVAGWLLFMNKTVARNLGQHTRLRSTRTHTSSPERSISAVMDV